MAGGGPPIPRTWHELWSPGRLQPMLARRAPAPFSSPEHRFEIKWDGYRCLAFVDPAQGRTFLQSRHGHDLTPLFPELAGLHRLLPAAAVLDGEIVALAAGRPSFAALQQRAAGVGAAARASRGRTAGIAPAVFVLFDLLGLGGAVWLPRPLGERVHRLERLFPQGSAPGVALSRGVEGQGEALFARVRDQGLEGVVAKRLDSPYLPGWRTGHWQKIKAERELDAVVGGVVPGGRAAGVGTLLVGLYGPDGALHYVGHVSTGLSGEAVRHLVGRVRPRATCPFATVPARARGQPVVWVEPTLVCEVAYLHWTPQGHLRHPVFRRWRDDLEPRDCQLPAEAGHPTGAGDGPRDGPGGGRRERRQGAPRGRTEGS
ncbi:MAG TPA: non-homologous end-joining DNA ligase [Thermaerobacter sp.]